MFSGFIAQWPSPSDGAVSGTYVQTVDPFTHGGNAEVRLAAPGFLRNAHPAAPAPAAMYPSCRDDLRNVAGGAFSGDAAARVGFCLHSVAPNHPGVAEMIRSYLESSHPFPPRGAAFGGSAESGANIISPE